MADVGVIGVPDDEGLTKTKAFVVLKPGAQASDVELKAFVKERMELAHTKASFWQDYKFTNPETKKIEPKSMYCEKLEDSVVCGGIYK